MNRLDNIKRVAEFLSSSMIPQSTIKLVASSCVS